MLLSDVIHLIGPGGAGKSTVGRSLAKRLGIAFIDLDDEFRDRAGDISAYLAAHGYEAYAAENVRAYLETSVNREAVFALSSGFMTYPGDVHPAYRELRSSLATSATTFVLLPSLDIESCVRETVRRQLARPFARSAAREENVIRERFVLYSRLPARKVETSDTIDAVVDSLLTLVHHKAHASADSRARPPDQISG